MRAVMKYRWSILAVLKKYAYDVKRYWTVLAVLSLVTIVLEFYIPNLYKIFVNDVILGKKLSKLSMVIGGYLLAFAVTYLVDYGKILSKYKVVNTVLYRIRKSILERYFSFTFAECEKVNIGDLKMRIDDDTEKIREFAYEQTSSYWVEWIKLIVSIILLFQINKQITILMLLAVPVTFYIDNILSKNEKKVLP